MLNIYIALVIQCDHLDFRKKREKTYFQKFTFGWF